jgi:NAD-dependent deacetylase
MSDTQQTDQLRQMIASHNRIVAFTGAGVSAESGIATYRGAGGLWSKYDPEKYASIDYFMKDPTYYWNFFRDERHDIMNEAEPNLAHKSLVVLEQQGKLSSVITQNIDGLHYKTGSQKVLELHGNTTRFYCFDCHDPYSMAEARAKLDKKLPPLCNKCGGVLRPDVVLFGEMLPTDVILEAEEEIKRCDLLIVIGSSLVVYPAANLPYQAKLNGAKLVILNIDPTPLDHMADLVIHRKAGDVMSQVVDIGLIKE